MPKAGPFAAAVAMIALGLGTAPVQAVAPSGSGHQQVSLRGVVSVRALSGQARKGGAHFPRLPLLRPQRSAHASGRTAPLRQLTAPTNARRSAPFATTAASADSVVNAFPGMGLEQQVAAFGTDQAIEPPDTQSAAGPTNIVEATNDSMSIWTKSGLRVAIVDLNRFFAVPANSSFTDPRVFYDPTTLHWFLSGLSVDSSLNSQVYVAASQTADPTQAWNTFSTPVSSGIVHDQPKFATSFTAIVMYWDDFDACSSNPSGFCFLGGTLLALTKSDLQTTPPPAIVGSQYLYTDNTGIFGAAAVDKPTGSNYAELLWNTNDTNNYSSIGFQFVAGTPPTASLSGASSNLSPTFIPPNARQPGPGLISTGDDRFLSVAFSSDSAVQWAFLNDGCAGAQYSCLRIVALQPSSVCNYTCFPTTPLLDFDEGMSGDFLYYPAGALDPAGNLYVVYSHSNASLHPSLETFGIPAGGSAPTSTATIAAGTTPYNSTNCGLANRWGDYSGIELDPSDPNVAWGAGEYAASADPCDWRTAIGELTFSGPQPYVFNPAPIASSGALSASTTKTVNLAVPGPGGTTVYLAFEQASGGGSASVGTTALTASLQGFASDGTGHVSIAYTTPAVLPTSGTDTITAESTGMFQSPLSAIDDYSFASAVATLAISPNPIAPKGSLSNTETLVDVVAKDSIGTPMAGATVYLSYSHAPGGGSATVNGSPLTAAPAVGQTGVNGDVQVGYQTPASLPNGGTDTITAQNLPAAATVSTTDSYSYATTTTFYFAEGFTGTGFHTLYSFLVPHQSGTVILDYYTQSGHVRSASFVTAGVTTLADASWAVGANKDVSVRATLPGPGIAERMVLFNNGTWHGSTDVVGVNAPAREWDFAEGSTLAAFNEFLSLQNPNTTSVNVSLNYATDIGAHPTKQLVLAPSSRTTIEVYKGDTNPNPNCNPLTSCGVGSGIVGVSVQVLADQPIVAERPMYVMNYSFGSGPIKDGHDAFGAVGPSTSWSFAEGNTLNGFNEYLTIQNPGGSAVNVKLHYIYDLGTKDVNMMVNANSRQTALVFDASHFGLGRPYVGVSVVVTANAPIVVERPMYMYFTFSGNGGSGPVAGAHDVVGSTSFQALFGFAFAVTTSGNYDYLTIENSNGVTANVSLTYYTQSGTFTRAVAVPAQTRHTVLTFVNSSEGIGFGFPPFGIVVTSDQPILVEKPTYSSNSPTYGATDTTAYTPSSF